MKIGDQRNLALQLLENPADQISLYDYDKLVREDKDIIDIFSFFAEYEDKFNNRYFKCDEKNGIFTKTSPIITSVSKSIRKINANNFEKLSAKICSCLGFDKEYYATQQSKDEGIDFIAFRDFSLLNIDYNEYIVGQSKHFSNDEITIKDIRELSGSVLLFSRKEFSVSNKYSKFVIGTFTPVNVFFITSYFFSNDAISLCKKTNIVPLDIIDVICILLDGIQNKKLKWIDNQNNFDEKIFINELKTITIVK